MEKRGCGACISEIQLDTEVEKTSLDNKWLYIKEEIAYKKLVSGN